MKRNIILIACIGLVSLFSSCKKDETKITMLANPIAPTLSTVPDLVLKRAEAGKMLQFIGTKADFGFSSSVTYNLEADKVGNEFKDPIVIGSNKVDTFNISVTSLNSILIAKLPLDATIPMEFRVRAELTIEASGATPIDLISAVKPVSVTTYGPPALSLTTAGKAQTITSPTDNKVYSGWIYTDGTGFTFTNKDNGKIYGAGATAGSVVENGTPIIMPAGAYNLNVDITNSGSIAMTSEDVTIGIIGNAVGGWDNDTKMVYNFTDKTWNITVNVVTGGIKFRTHGGWAAVNVAYDPAGHDLNNLYQANSRPGAGDSQNITDIAPGKYNVKFFLESKPMKATFTPAT